MVPDSRVGTAYLDYAHSYQQPLLKVVRTPARVCNPWPYCLGLHNPGNRCLGSRATLADDHLGNATSLTLHQPLANPSLALVRCPHAKKINRNNEGQNRKTKELMRVVLKKKLVLACSKMLKAQCWSPLALGIQLSQGQYLAESLLGTLTKHLNIFPTSFGGQKFLRKIEPNTFVMATRGYHLWNPYSWFTLSKSVA